MGSLRRRVERSGRRRLSELALEALDLADASCWVALVAGDVAEFERVSGVAVALGDFSVGAGLLP